MQVKSLPYDKSHALFERAQLRLPGGVDSPVRAFRKVGGEPFFVERGKGAKLYDVDGNEYVDYVMSWGPLMLGHAHPAILNAVRSAAEHGTSFGAPTSAEVELAELVTALVPSIDMVRFVNSGTEATMSAVRLARGATERDFIVKFSGCYHGHGDSFLVHAGSGVATLGLPDSPGVPMELAKLTLTLPYNDSDAVRDLFSKRGSEIACVIVEPVLGNSGFIPPVSGFLQHLRDITAMYGTLLIFDEVMTGFRVGLGGAQELYNIEPDLTTLGKVIGGGLPVGAYGGRRDLMELVAPLGPIYQAGTLSGNPLAMAAGIAQLRQLRDLMPYDVMQARARRLLDAMIESAHDVGLPMWGDAIGGMWGFHFTDTRVRSFEQAKKIDPGYFNAFFWAALERGVYLPPSPFEAAFMSTEHDDDVIDFTIEQVRDAMKEIAR